MIAGSLDTLYAKQLHTKRVCFMGDPRVKLFLEKKVKMPINKNVLALMKIYIFERLFPFWQNGVIGSLVDI